MAGSRAHELFLAALDRPAEHRAEFLAGACGGDAALGREVESLLQVHGEEHPPAAAPVGDTGPPSFAAGDVFAGRYRMVARIGTGGIGDVWRANDLVLDTDVALKLVRPLGREGRASILDEARQARSITHPAVCRVFDVGEADGQIFYSMEFVHGEDLAALLRRVGRLPSEKLVDVARQLCGGLAAAHAQGVLHRDLRPANVLIDDDGRVRIADFGIAVAGVGDGAGDFTGTPGYRAPELTLGLPFSGRTDIYALGLMLYELAAGRRAFEAGDTSRPPKLSSLQPDIDPEMEAVIHWAISRNPADRPATAAAMAERLPLSTGGVGPRTGSHRAPAGRRRAGVWLAAAATLAVALAIVAGPMVRSRFFPALSERDTIVLADFENTTGEPVFDGALRVALAVALEQSPFLQVFPEDRVREALRLMERSAEDAVTRSVARDIARREGIKALIGGSIARLGSHYVIALEAINTETGDVMAREQMEAGSQEQVLTALGSGASRLRQRLGESLASIEKFDVPLPRATTPSLEALHAYALALDEGRISMRLSAIPYLKRAIELDPQFALAYAMLSAVYANNDQPGLAPGYARRAFELRDRVSERERFFIAWRYYRDAAFAAEQALDVAQSWAATYPREAMAFNSLGLALVYVGQYERGIEAFREAMRLDPKFFAPYGNIAEAQLALGNLDEAQAALRLADERRINVTAVRRVSYLVAFSRGDADEMSRQFALAAAVPESNPWRWQARASTAAGRVRTAHDEFRRAIQSARDRGLNESAAQILTEDAEGHAVVGQCAEAREEAGAALGASRDDSTLQRANRVFALCGDDRMVASLSGELAGAFPEASLIHRVLLPVANAALAVGRGDAVEARRLLAPVAPYDHTQVAELWSWYLRGLASLQLKAGREAAAEFQQLIDHRGARPASLLVPLSYLGLARAAALTGDRATAGTMYQAFLDRWGGADPDVRMVNEARLEYAGFP